MREEFKQTVKDLLGNGISFPVDIIDILKSNCIYIYLNNNDALYIGKSQNGILRALDKRHSKKVIKECDELVIYKAKDYDSMMKAERLLIRNLNPKYNLHYNKTKIS